MRMLANEFEVRTLARDLFKKPPMATFLWFKPVGETQVSQIVLTPVDMSHAVNEGPAAKKLKAVIDGRTTRLKKHFKVYTGTRWARSAVIIDADKVTGKKLLHKFYDEVKDMVETTPKRMT